MHINPFRPGVPQNRSNVQSPLHTDSLKLLKNEFGFKGVKIVQIEKGAEALRTSFTVQMDVSEAKSSLIQSEVAQALGLEDLESVVVVLGGLRLVEEQLKKLKKLRVVRPSESLKTVSNLLGIDDAESIVMYVDDTPGKPANVIIQAGLKEIEDGILSDSEKS